MSDGEIIQQRISGRSVHARCQGKGHPHGRRQPGAFDLSTEATFNDQVRKHTLALELARLDELQELFYRQAKAGDVQSA